MPLHLALFHSPLSLGCRQLRSWHGLGRQNRERGVVAFSCCPELHNSFSNCCIPQQLELITDNPVINSTCYYQHFCFSFKIKWSSSGVSLLLDSVLCLPCWYELLQIKYWELVVVLLFEYVIFYL